jgi:nucleotide-binding universal stress UspA family protein
MVQIVMSWEPPLSHGWVPPTPENGHLKEKLRRSLDAIVAKLLAEHPTAVVESKFVEGHPAPTLIEASRGAELLVVGSRGHGSFGGMRLGSVSEHCAAHAKCPVLVHRSGD